MVHFLDSLLLVGAFVFIIAMATLPESCCAIAARKPLPSAITSPPNTTRTCSAAALCLKTKNGWPIFIPVPRRPSRATQPTASSIPRRPGNRSEQFWPAFIPPSAQDWCVHVFLWLD